MPLSPRQWSEAHAKHLLRRIGFSATPGTVKEAMQRGLDGTLEHYFGTLRPMLIPEKVKLEVAETPKLKRKIRQTQDPEIRRQLQREIRMLDINSYQDFGISWLTFARQQDNSPQEKYIMFLQDIFVVGRGKVRANAFLFQHQNMLRKVGYGTYPEIAKAVSRSPAMIQYLDLHRSTRQSPNENFARELFELFTLGEGNYTEKDIKEAARAFTGYRFKGGEFHFYENAYDTDPKTVFGRTGHWNGDEVIDIVYEQSAAATFVPREFIKFYVTEDALDEPYIQQLGKQWAENGFDMHYLIETVFRSQLFYQPEYRGNLIKSPIHYYLGLCQDLRLDVAPFPNRIFGALRGMGQVFQRPPNVRGWVGGKHWINTSTLSARRQVAQVFFKPINEKNLNADDYVELQAARAEGRAEFVVTDERLSGLADKSPSFIAEHFCGYFLPAEPPPAFRDTLVQFLESRRGKDYIEGIQDVTIAILQSPHYQLS